MKNKKTIIVFCIFAPAFYFLLSTSYFVPSVRAFESTSTTFEIHAGDIESTVASSTSATFRLHNAGGQTATASSSLTTTSISSGILYWLYGFFTARYEQIHYRWRADDNTEALATFPINIDTQHVSFPKNTVKRLRFEVSNEGWTRGADPAFTLEAAQTATCSGGTYAPVLADYSGHWHIATSTQFTDGAATTNVSGCSLQSDCVTDENGNFVAGQIKDTGNTTSAVHLTSRDFTEVEYGVMALDAAVNGATYCFRLNDGLSPTRMAYTQYPSAVIASGLPVTGSLDSAVFDTFTTAAANQGPAYNSIMWNGAEEGTGKVRFQLATSDCANGKTNYPDCNDAGVWTFYGSDDGGATCDSGSYYDTLTSGAGGGPGKPVEISCSASQSQNNKRYFKYRIQICSSDCSASGVTSPIVDDVVVNWAP
ncbi:MAG: hypothetical protein AAB497_03320 [Patescibacteria group bacterium]